VKNYCAGLFMPTALGGQVSGKCLLSGEGHLSRKDCQWLKACSPTPGDTSALGVAKGLTNKPAHTHKHKDAHKIEPSAGEFQRMSKIVSALYTIYCIQRDVK
jgi:hypothetical protein